MTNEFENFNDRDEEWLRELELRATDLENDLFDWREAHAPMRLSRRRVAK